MAKLGVVALKTLTGNTIKPNGAKQITGAKDQAIRFSDYDSYLNLVDGGQLVEQSTGYLTELVVSDSRAWVALFQMEQAINDAIGLGNYLPKSAGAGEPLTGDLYAGGNNIRNTAGVYGANTLQAIGLSSNNRTLNDKAGDTIVDFSTRADGLGITDGTNYSYIKSTTNVNESFSLPNKGGVGGTFAMLSDITSTQITGKLLTGYTSGAGVVAATDTILQAIQKLNGNTAALVSSQWVTTGSDIYYSTGGAMIGINAAPSGKLHTVETAVTTLRGVVFDQYNAGTNSSQINARKARGTFGAPAAIVSGDILSNWNTWAHDGTSFVNAAAIRVVSAGTIGTGRTPTQMMFMTMTDVTTGVITTALTLDQAQNAIFTGTITAASDTDVTNILGRAKIGSPATLSDNAAFGHFDRFTAADVGLRQLATGQTILNAPSSSNILLASGGGTIASIDNNGVNITAGKTLQGGTGTGFYICNSTAQKVGFWATTPTVQPSGANQAAVTDITTGIASFTLVNVGLSFNQANINNNFASLARQTNELRNVLLTIGLMKGSA